MRKLLFLALAGMMSIAVLGVGYALWSDTLEIHGSVATGNVDVALQLEAVIEDEDTETLGSEAGSLDTGAPGDDLDNTEEWKDVAQCGAVLLPDGSINVAPPNTSALSALSIVSKSTMSA